MGERLGRPDEVASNPTVNDNSLRPASDNPESPKVFATFYARLFPAAFHKGVGQMAYHIAGVRGWAGRLAYCEQEPCAVPAAYAARVETKNLGASDGSAMTARLRQAASLVRFLRRDATKIDLLNLYDLRPETYLGAVVFKRLNPSGKVFIKLDMDQRAANMLLHTRKGVKQVVNEWLLEHCGVDFVTVETKQIEQQVRGWFETRGIPVHLAPIGFSYPGPLNIQDTIRAKENLIISVGRLGTRQKHNELLIEALCRLPPGLLQGWRVAFIGPGSESFAKWVREYTAAYPHVRAAVDIVRSINDREELYDWYRRARVFCLTSRWESFCTVLGEASYFGCVLVSTRVGAAADLTGEGADGRLFDVEDRAGLERALTDVMSSPAGAFDEIAARCHQRVAAQFSWERVCRDLLAFADAREAPTNSQRSSATRRPTENT